MPENIDQVETDSHELAEQIRLMQEQEAELAAKYEEQKKRLAQLKALQEKLLTDPKERAKMLKNANDMIEAGVKEYESKGYCCDVHVDEHGLLEKIVFKADMANNSLNRNPRKKEGDEGYEPPMTAQQFATIYPLLGNNFKNEDVVKLLVSEFGKGKYSSFRTQPVLGKILKDGHEGIRFEKVGTKGRNVYYVKSV